MNVQEIEQFLGTVAQWESKERLMERLMDMSRVQPGMNKGGIPLVYHEGTAYVDAEDSHTLIIGSTGSKKTRLVVMPAVKLLAQAGESMIISDPKAEVYNRTAFEMAAVGYQIRVINFRNPSVGDCWNPLAIPFAFYQQGDLDRACEFVNDIAGNLILSEVSKADPFWDYCASDLLFGLIMLSFKRTKNPNGVSIRTILQLRQKMFDNNGNVDRSLRSEASMDPLIYSSLVGTLNAPEKTRTSILAVFDQKMRCFMYQKNLTEMMDANTISLDHIGVEKTAFYLIMPDEKTTYHRLAALFIKQSYEYLIYLAQATGVGSFKTRINYMLDEFSSLPTIKDFPTMISAARSRNIRFNLVVQSQNQLKARYHEEAETIKSNCNNWIFLTSRELELLEEISNLCGEKADGKPLLSVSALQHLDKNQGQALLLCGRLFPYITQLEDINHYDNGGFQILPFKERTEQ
ncbi:MAG: type IV secretory system conjugative DNA transfer family protein [Lachnospiraceae bacterium]|nr:type IV secretory system conjugative DNA transfer family protein [Lachnospiraceae bacterium]